MVNDHEDMLLWTYGLRMQFGVGTVHWAWQRWHPSYGLQTTQAWSERVPVLLRTDKGICDQLWVGATELLERVTGA